MFFSNLVLVYQERFAIKVLEIEDFTPIYCQPLVTWMCLKPGKNVYVNLMMTLRTKPGS